MKDLPQPENMKYIRNNMFSAPVELIKVWRFLSYVYLKRKGTTYSHDDNLSVVIHCYVERWAVDLKQKSLSFDYSLLVLIRNLSISLSLKAMKTEIEVFAHYQLFNNLDYCIQRRIFGFLLLAPYSTLHKSQSHRSKTAKYTYSHSEQ